MDEIRFFKESKALRQTILDSRPKLLSDLLQAQGERELGTDSVAIGRTWLRIAIRLA